MKRGEKIDELQGKTGQIKITTQQIKKKAKKMNAGFCGGLCGGGSASRGGVISKPGVVTTMKAVKTAGSIKDSL